MTTDVQKYRKKPVVIDAVKLTDENIYAVCDWVANGGNEAEVNNDRNALIISTLEGDHRADLGDWIIRGVAGEHYPCKPEIFAQTYEASS